MADTWLIRAGRQGQHEQFCLDDSTVGAGWHETPDLTATVTWDDVKAVVEATIGGSSATVANYTGQLWRLRHGIKVGDVVVMPMKTTSQLAIGKVVTSYRYDAGADPYRRHRVDVEWLVTDIPRTAVKQDLLFSLGSAMTVCALNRNDAAWRIEQLAATGIDPGARAATASPAAPKSNGPDEDTGDDITSPEQLDLGRLAKDRLSQVIAERFAGYDMQELVADVLRAEGFQAEVPPKGADGGVDVIAGSGPLGLDSPLVVVQVKSGAKGVESPVVQQLLGAISSLGADYGLLVAWGGLSDQARREVRAHRLKVRVWDADALIDAICRNYDGLSGETQAKLPLKPMWVVVEDT